MEISAKTVMQLREMTGAGMMDCKEALRQASGDMAEAEKILRKQDKVKAAKKAGRSANQGLVQAYVHAGGRIGVLVEVNCETDFAAASDDFKELAKDIAMHIAAANPLRRLGRIEEVVAAIRYLASAEASYTNGVILPVNGGSHLS